NHHRTERDFSNELSRLVNEIIQPCTGSYVFLTAWTGPILFKISYRGQHSSNTLCLPAPRGYNPTHYGLIIESYGLKTEMPSPVYMQAQERSTRASHAVGSVP